jgi:hypothetical protein
MMNIKFRLGNMNTGLFGISAIVVPVSQFNKFVACGRDQD